MDVSARRAGAVPGGLSHGDDRGTALAALFAQPLVHSRAIAVLGMSGCLLLSVPLDVPPTITVAQAFASGRPSEVPRRLIDDVAIVAVFGATVTVVCVALGRRCE